MLSRDLFTSSGEDLAAGFVPNGNRIDGADVAGSQQPVPFSRGRVQEDRDPGLVQLERLRGFGDTVAEADAQCAIDPYAQIPDGTLFEVAHIPSSPSSARAVSMTAGVISVMPCSLA